MIEPALRTMNPSKHDTAMDCLARFFYSYVERIKRKPTAAMALGNAWDETSNVVMGAKVRSGRTASPDDVQECFTERWRDASADVEDFGEDEGRDVLADRGRKVARIWTGSVASKFQPASTQGYFEMPVQSPWDDDDGFVINGRMDTFGEWVEGQFAGTGPTVIDNKFSGRRWSAGQATVSLQGPTYSIAARQLGFVEGGPYRMQWHIATSAKQPELQIIGRVISQDEVDQTVIRYSKLRKMLRAVAQVDGFLPNRSSRLCSRRWCAYWERCQNDHGGIVPQ